VAKPAVGSQIIQTAQSLGRCVQAYGQFGKIKNVEL